MITTDSNIWPVCREQAIGDLVDRRARQDPEAVAIAAPGRRPLRYRDLRLQVDTIGSALRNWDVTENKRVAVAMPNGPEMAVAFVGVSAFAVCAPLNPAYRFEEFAFYLADLQASALIVQRGSCTAAVAAAKERSVPVIEVAPVEEGRAGVFSLGVADRAQDAPLRFSRAGDRALLLHTSGTTSRPKRVELTHQQLVASAANIAAGLRLTPQDRCLNLMPLFHIHGLIGALLASISAGASVTCTPGFDAESILEWLEDCRPTWYSAVPTIHQAVLSCMNADSEAARRHSLRFIRSCSAALPPEVARKLEDIFRIPVIEAYGMTEAAHQIASNPLPPAVRKFGSVGLPTGTEIAIRDRNGVLPPGEVGEISVRGASVITRYAHAESSQEENFTDGWLRTGDQGYFDKDGYLFLTGRLKEIINRGGEKISPREIEEALLRHPEIAQAAVFRVPHASLGDDIGAAVVREDGSELTECAIREYLLARIAAFKVPGEIFILDEIPKGATGKVSRTTLSERFGSGAKSAAPEYVNGGDSSLEETLIGIYREVLGTETIGPRDNFFACGGDSLRATQVINRVRKLLEVNLSIATIFRKPTVTDLVGEIARTREGKRTRLLPG